MSGGGNGGNGAEAGSDTGKASGGSGGAGGAGGAVTLNLNANSVSAMGASDAGTGNTVTVNAIVNNALTTATARASVLRTAVGAFSLGGRGGYGDYGSGATSGKGGGGAAGAGGPASINLNVATITTSGYGALAMSVGGSGGNGASGGGIFSRSGGGGGSDVAAVNLAAGLVTTTGRNSDGVAALSIGGGGGVAGNVIGGGVGISVSLGGQGSAGSPASVANGYWTQDNSGNWNWRRGAVILTTGTYVRGIGAASIGGRGRGGDANSANLGLLSLSIGGNGGTGGQANAGNYGAVQTRGSHSVGIDVASIGGGGGAGGAAHSFDVGALFTAAAAVGGTGGGCMTGEAGTCPTGGAATVNNFGQILTIGSEAYGIHVQSIGGGGHGGATVADALSVNPGGGQVPNFTVMACIGGAGSRGGDSTGTSQSTAPDSVNVSVALGGSGGAAGGGDAVQANNSGFIWTLHDQAPGVAARSVGGGGGGGNGGFGRAHTGTRGGGSGWGGQVTVTNSGSITTGGDVSPAILAQSVGGGGGPGATTLATPQTGNIHSVTLGMDGSSGSPPVPWNNGSNSPGPSGGPVSVTSSGAIATKGNDSPGIVAQSVGGGIAVVMSPFYDPTTGKATSATGNLPQTQQQLAFAFQGNAPSNALGGAVNVTVQDNGISTQGRNAHAIVAQSVGNGGGISSPTTASRRTTSSPLRSAPATTAARSTSSATSRATATPPPSTSPPRATGPPESWRRAWAAAES